MNCLDQSQFWVADKIKDYQNKRLKKLLIHAYDTTEYYRRIFDEYKFNPRKYDNPGNLKKLPLLSKDDIRTHIDGMVSNKFSPDELHSSETGGTTGVKMKFYRDNYCLNAKEAGLYRFEKWTGWNIGERMGLIWPAQQDYVGHWTWKSRLKNELFNRQVVFPAAVLDKKAISDFIFQLQSRKPSMIRAFTSPMHEVAKYIIQHQPKVPQLKGIITTGEPLYTNQKDDISRAFGCKVLDSYRSREAGPIAQECNVQDGLHINAECVFIEIIPCEEMHSCSADIGEIVITDLLNYGMPLIRYRMGDLGQLNLTQCKCGRGLPRIQNIQGRTADLFYSPEDKRIAAGALVLYLVDEAPGDIGQVQIIQDRIDHIIIRMTKDPQPSSGLMEYQKKTVKRLFGNQMEVSFDLVEQIPRESSGKYRFTKCLIENSDNA